MRLAKKFVHMMVWKKTNEIFGQPKTLWGVFCFEKSKYIHHYKFKVKSKIFDIWEIMLLGWERDMHSESQTNGGLQIILLRNGERVIAGNSSQVGTVLERSWVRMDWSDLMTGWLLWESVGVKERKESGRNLRFSFCAALATWSRDISSGWEHSQKNKYRLEVGRKAWASFGFGG